MLRSPYRCRECGERFSVASRRGYFLATIAAAIVLVIMGMIASSSWDNRRSVHEPAELVPAEFTNKLKLAESGDVAAEHQLAQVYAVGDGVAKNEKEAAKWLARAAQHGDAESQYELGIALRDGRGIVQDDAGAFAWLQKAADVGNAQAQFEVGRMYFIGAGTPVDKIRAYTWLNLAAAQGAVGAAPLRDVVRSQLSPDEIVRAQAEARHLSELQANRTAKHP